VKTRILSENGLVRSGFAQSFFSLSISLLAPIQGIIARNRVPASLIGCAAAFARIAFKAFGGAFLKDGLRRAIIIFMRQVLNDIEAGKLADELKRRGIKPSQRLRVIVESIDSDALPMTIINATGGAFDWLAGEPDLYSDADLVERYRA
jgi:hypothetical protein